MTRTFIVNYAIHNSILDKQFLSLHFVEKLVLFSKVKFSLLSNMDNHRHMYCLFSPNKPFPDVEVQRFGCLTCVLFPTGLFCLVFPPTYLIFFNPGTKKMARHSFIFHVALSLMFITRQRTICLKIYGRQAIQSDFQG